MLLCLAEPRAGVFDWRRRLLELVVHLHDLLELLLRQVACPRCGLPAVLPGVLLPRRQQAIGGIVAGEDDRGSQVEFGQRDLRAVRSLAPGFAANER